MKVFETFSGIGTQRMALNRLGAESFEVVAISEIDEQAIKSYEAIHGKTKNLGDISKINIEDVPEHNLFTYTFPCQDISLNGKLKGLSVGSGTRSSLLWEAMRIVEGVKPEFLVAENVINLVSKRLKDDFDKWIKYLDEIGYNTYYKKINSKLFGIPQNRERAFVVSIRKDIDDRSFKFNIPNIPTKPLLDILEQNVDEKYLANDKLAKVLYKEDNEPFVGNQIKIRNATKIGYILASHGDGVDASFFDSNTRRGRVQKSMIQTLTTQSEHFIVILENDGVFSARHFTPLEYWRLMGINDIDFHKARATGLKDKPLYKQAGNAIVVDILYYIFKELLDIYDKL